MILDDPLASPEPGFHPRSAVVVALALATMAGVALQSQLSYAQPPAPAATPDANALYTSVLGAFDRGDYQGAVRSIDELAAQIPPRLPAAEKEALTAQLERIYFIRGAAYYDLKEWDKGAAAFEDYLSRYPAGAFIADAKYRRARCLLAGQKNDATAAACGEWLREYPQDQRRGEVLSLLGDAQAAAGHPDEALDAYTRALQSALNDELLGHSVAEAAKLLEQRGDWPAIAAMCEAFVRARPDHPLAATAMSWIVRADMKEGKSEAARQFVAAHIGNVMPDPRREGVEALLDQLATLCSPQQPNGNTSASATPAADPDAQLTALLAEAEKDRSPTAGARVLYARAQLARLRRRDGETTRDLLEIGLRFAPADLSAVLLGQAGDALLAAGKTDEAAPLFQRLLDAFPTSEVADFGYRGLGEIALRKQKYAEALRCFDDGIAKTAGANKLKDLTLGKANALLGLGRLDEARKFFAQVAATHEWRGEATAASVFFLGEIEARQQRWAEANAYYQRVYVAYQRFPPWVAKAYLGSAASLEKLGKRQDAINTYREMLRNRTLSDRPEGAEARRRLQALGAG